VTKKHLKRRLIAIALFWETEVAKSNSNGDVTNFSEASETSLHNYCRNTPFGENLLSSSADCPTVFTFDMLMHYGVLEGCGIVQCVGCCIGIRN